MRDMFREPKAGEGMAEYVIPRAIVLFSFFLFFIAVCCVIGTYID